jgi:hypothetical protein
VPKPSAGPAIEASQLDTFLLRDSKGNLVPVLGMTFDEFEQLLKLKNGLAAPPPPGFTLDALSVSGAVEGDLANVQVTATIRIRDEGWVRVPLKLGQAILRQAPRYEGPGEHFLSYDDAEGEYVAWLQGKDGKPHVLTMQYSANLTRSGEESRLELLLPRATESTLRLNVAGGPQEASMARGEGIVSVQQGNDRSEITVLGPAGDLQLSWRKARGMVQGGPALFDASGEIAVKVESESRISSDARLRIRSLNGPVEVVQIRLPPGMELVPTSHTGYSVSVASAPAASAGKTAPQMVEVRFDRPATGVAEVRLLASSLPLAGLEPKLLPGRFEVVNAVRQRGTIDFTVEGEWQVQWSEDPTVQRVDISADPSASLLAARYEYFRQPCGLSLQVSPRPSRVSVEPTYVVHVEPRQVRVETTLKYKLRGSRPTALEFQLGDTRFDRLSPDDVFEPPDAPGTDGVLRMPLRQDIPAPTDLELKFETHKILPEGAKSFSLTLPRPRADTIAPATVFVVAADNIELTPRASELQGLSPDASPVPVRMPTRQQQPLVYRDLGSGEPAVFAAEMEVKMRATITSARATVRLDRQQLQVQQRLEYRIAHEPQRSFVLRVPRGLSAAGGLQVWMGTVPLTVMPPAEAPSASAAGQLLQFSTPSELIGQAEFSVRYSMPMPKWEGQQPLQVSLPLVLPAEESNHQFAGQHIEFDLGEGLHIEPELTGADEFSRPTAVPGADARPTFTWSKAAGMTNWIVQPSRSAQAAAVVWHKAWVQTWLASDVRQERAVFRLTTAEEEVRLRLPSGVAPSSVQAAVNAQPVTVTLREPSLARISLPASARGHECILEIWYALPAPGRRLGFLSDGLRPAVLEGATPPRRLYWQLALPENEQLIVPPGDLAAEMSSTGSTWLLGRSPLLDQRQLEAWIGASRQDPLPHAVNQYLFGAVGQTPTMDLAVASRRLVLTLASGLALAGGLAILFLPWLRSATTLLVATVLLGAASLALPDAALLAGRSALLGLAVVFVVGAWRWFFAGRPAWPSNRTGTIVKRFENSASTTHPVNVERSQPLTTATAPAALAAGELRP